MPEAVAVPLQPEMLAVTNPALGAAAQVVVPPAVTGDTQLSVPPVPAKAVATY